MKPLALAIVPLFLFCGWLASEWRDTIAIEASARAYASRPAPPPAPRLTMAHYDKLTIGEPSLNVDLMLPVQGQEISRVGNTVTVVYRDGYRAIVTVFVGGLAADITNERRFSVAFPLPNRGQSHCVVL